MTFQGAFTRGQHPTFQRIYGIATHSQKPSGVGRAIGFADGRGKGVSAWIRQTQTDARLRAWRCVDFVCGGSGCRFGSAVRGCRVDLVRGNVGLILCDAGWVSPCLPGSG